MCVLLITRLLRLVGRWARKPVNHTSWVALVTPTDRPKSVRNRCLIELFCGVVCVVTCPFDIWLGQISSFLSFMLSEWDLARKTCTVTSQPYLPQRSATRHDVFRETWRFISPISDFSRPIIFGYSSYQLYGRKRMRTQSYDKSSYTHRKIQKAGTTILVIISTFYTFLIYKCMWKWKKKPTLKQKKSL